MKLKKKKKKREPTVKMVEILIKQQRVYAFEETKYFRKKNKQASETSVYRSSCAGSTSSSASSACSAISSGTLPASLPFESINLVKASSERSP